MRIFWAMVCVGALLLKSILDGMGASMFWDLPTYSICLLFGVVFLFKSGRGGLKDFSSQEKSLKFWQGFYWGAIAVALFTGAEILKSMTLPGSDFWQVAFLMAPSMACLVMSKTVLKITGT
ncbi:MAG: hypothetical protein OXT67_11400 [Zetaproteobacteria bacterium]|nr:hypothetical protein [Zetaproteobacteria bacterium]